MVPINHSQAKLFDKKFVALALRDARQCVKCKHEFDTKYKYSTSDNKPHSCRPVLLNCGHNICENCIYQHRHNLECAVCSIPIVFEHTRWLKKSYDLNFSLLGQLINSKAFLSSESSPAAAGTYMQNTGMLAQESFTQKCSECEHAAAIGICMRCKVDFCKRCFTSVHQNSKVLKKHTLSEFETQKLQLHTPTEKICKLHKRLCDRFCSDCLGVFCSQCVRLMHNTHRVSPLTIENANHKDKIISFLETMKQTREHIRQAQKKARVCENRMEDFATGLILDVNNFFLELHNELQLEERRIIETFKKSARSSQKAIHEAFVKLSDGQTTLNNMRSSLEGYLHKPPNGFHINAAIEMATLQLEQIPCQIQISEIESNPFVFKKIKNLHSEISKSYEAIALDPKISIRITPMYENSASFEISSERSISPQPMSLTRMESIDYQQDAMSISSSSTPVGRSKRVGRVTHIVSPSKFYVQDEDVIAEVRQRLVDIDGNTGLIESVNINEMYLVYHVTDKAWFRGVVKGEIRRPKTSKDGDGNKYKVFLLDYGINDEIYKKHLRKVQEKDKLIPAAAFSCCLLDISPSGKGWTSESRELMEEIIQNKPVQVIIQNTTKSPWNVEIAATNSGESISIRDALLYTGLGVDSSATMSQRNLKFPGIKPTQVSKMKHRLQRPMLHPGEFFRVKIKHIENPQQFFAIKFAELEELDSLESELDMQYSGKQGDAIYYAQLHMCCALLVADKWYRGCVEEINDANNIRVRLVDDGRSVTVNWRQLRKLKDCFTVARELSIECSLADVQPLQENNYEWTETAIAEFVRMTSNPNIHITIASSNQFRYQVILNAVKKHLDINIGAMLVRFKHALTTGEASATVDNVRTKKSPEDPLFITEGQNKQPTDSIEMPTLRTLKRTPIQVININNPGEFYIHLVEHIPGIIKFHEQLQLEKENRLPDDTVNNLDWKLNDHCLVLTQINDTAAEQWFRGVIVNIDDHARYTVFLRDRGLTIRDLRKNQLNPIKDLFDRICNGAILCHLACVHPTGGMKKWSNSSIDEFIHNVHTFESLGATIQGVRSPKNSSIPVVLWGMVTESNDPLAPCTTKYTNINKILVCAGLVHMTEKIDLARQLDQFMEEELEQGQQTLQDWYENFKKTLEKLPTESLEEMNESEAELSIALGCQSDENEFEPATEWLPAEPIVKTVFTGYPTYVDEEAIVYLHDADKHVLLSKMRNKINQNVELKPLSKMIDEAWTVGQPCLARYHLDNSLYRAIIQSHLKDSKYEVRFIDYGNIEACEARDLHRMTAFPNIPTQAVPFRIDGIKPRGGKAKFSTIVLDLIHGVIVDKHCAIRVPNGEEKKEIKKCSIRFGRNDLATYLIQNGFAEGTTAKMNSRLNRIKNELPPCPQTMESVSMAEGNNSDDELREFMKHQICDPTEEPNTCTPPPEQQNQDAGAMINPEEYRRLFEKMQTEKLYKSITEIDSDLSPPLEGIVASDDDDDVVELEFSFRSNYWHVDHNVEGSAPPKPQSDAESNFDNFEPFDSSSLLSNFSGIEVFKQPQLPSSLKSFYCDVTDVRSPTIFHVFPHLSELTYRQVEMARRIQLMARKMAPLETFELKTPCLAKYSKDNLWYRAIIRMHNITTHQVKVFYVDFLNTEHLPEDCIRRCPKDLLMWPLRTFEMKLFGLRANPRMREKDVKQALKKCIKGRKLYAKIIRERGKMTEVCLFNSKAEKEVAVYEDLIIQNYFCKE